MSNFIFLKNSFPSLYRTTVIAERRVFTEPKNSAHSCRLALEEAVHLIYREERLTFPYHDRTLHTLMREVDFKYLMDEDIYGGVFNYVRKIGNDGAHYGKTVRGKDALISIRYLFDFLKWFANDYAAVEPDLPDVFDISYVPKVGSDKTEQRKKKEQSEEREQEKKALEDKVAALLKKLEEQEETAMQSEMAMQQYKVEQEAAIAKLKTQKKTRKKKLSKEYNESETREHLIDIALRESGWLELREGYELEFPVKGMPITPDNPKGNGYVDYVLWDDNGKPLALIEAKRTSVAEDAGKHQAFLYANCLEEKYGQRPIIFYSNGYRTMLWDDAFYSQPRRVYGFYIKDELQWAIQRRSTLKDIRKADINKHISGRPYQEEAIRRVAETFVITESGSEKLRGAARAALLVMATGSGKTRTSASLVDVLFKNNWIKRVLFLADRNALVKQAKDAFSEHLPELSSINLSKEKENNTTRLVFSTYQSIINKIDSAKSEDGRFYGVGHFDLIVIDESHRSVYNKFGVIFEYFDAILLGLTATPKREVDFNTYELFDCVEGNPTFAYELEDAVNSKFLNSYKNISLSTKFLRNGIKYSELSDEEKEKYEESFRDSTWGLFPEEVSRSSLNKWLFNKDTVNKILDALMEHGLKIEGGDKLGRTIVFAANQDHAKYIVDCFTERYPQYPSGFISMIHNKVSHSQSLIDAFCDHHNENLPQIAVSVDMMDTGIDAPRTLNLVFFKVVRSYSKFWQMIGRGTRLCPDVFGVGKPKEYFLIFDACDNFAFFEENEYGKDAKHTPPITQQIFNTRLAVAKLLLETGDDEDRALAKKKVDMLHAEIKALDKARFDVNMKLEFVDEFELRDSWNRLDSDSIHIIEENLSALPVPESINETARRFDLMMLKMMQANLLMDGKFGRYKDSLMGIGEELSKKYAVPQVEAKKSLIEQIRDPKFFEGLRQRKMEEVREEVRNLMQFLDATIKNPVYTNIVDTEVSVVQEPLDIIKPINEEVYKRRVEQFVRENKRNIVIDKLNRNLPVTPMEIKELEKILFDGGERGTYDQYKEVYDGEPLGKFIRSIVGLDIKIAQEHFSEFLNAGNLNANQIKFIDTIIQFLNKNGIIDKALLDQPPFDDAHEDGLFGLFGENETVRIISLIDGINRNAEVG